MAKYYTVSISGYGGESVYGKITKDQYEFWSNEDKVLEAGFEDHDGALSEWFWEPTDWEDKVPAEAQFDCDWHDLDDIEHSNGCELNSAKLEICQVENGDYMAPHVADVWEGEIKQLITEQDIEVTENILDLDDFATKDGHNYVFYGCSAEKGNFYFATIKLSDDEEFDIKQLNFDIYEMPNGDTIVHDVSYKGEFLDNEGGDTTGKAMYLEVWDY